MKSGTVGGRKREWGGKGRGGGQFTSNLGPEWTGIAPHAKEGFQVSKRDSGTGERLILQAGENYLGVIKGIVPCVREASYMRLISWALQSGSEHYSTQDRRRPFMQR